MATRTTVLAVALVLGSLAVAVAPVATTDASAGTGLADTQSVVDSCAAEQPANFSDPDGDTADIVGWVEGYWYDEPLDIDATDGLNGTELERLSARTAARFEALRCLTVQDGVPPVDIVPREEFAANQQSSPVGNTTRLIDNARFETTLTIDSQTDAVEVRRWDRALRYGGYYDSAAEEVVIITEDSDALPVHEIVLAEELGHAIQDQHFYLAGYDYSTIDRNAGIRGLIEGDVRFVVREYFDACEAGEWAEPCLVDQAGNGSSTVPNWGVYLEEMQPYSEGPSFVQEIKQEGGWDAVDALYDDPPTSALHTTYPDTYGVVEPRDIEMPDRSTADWERVPVITKDTLGVSAITAMFAAPALENGTDGQILPESAVIKFDESGLLNVSNLHTYAHPETEGWRGDSLYTFTSADNETATLWKTAWATPEDAEPFVDSYGQLAEIRGGERVDGYAHTYTFDNGTGYDMALTIVPDGDRVTVVTAPTVEALTAIDQELELVTQNDTGGDGSDDDGTDDGSDDGSDDASDDGTDDGSDDGTDDGTDDANPELVVLTIFGTALLAALALLTMGGQRRQ